jgi:hypothetical protein
LVFVAVICYIFSRKIWQPWRDTDNGLSKQKVDKSEENLQNQQKFISSAFYEFSITLCAAVKMQTKSCVGDVWMKK